MSQRVVNAMSMRQRVRATDGGGSARVAQAHRVI